MIVIESRVVSLLALFCLAAMVACGESEDSSDPVAHPTVEFDPEATRPAVGYRGDYEFSEDWFSKNIPVWQKVLREYVGTPGIAYLEVGVYEGRASIWILENVLTGDDTTLTALDIFTDDGIEERWLDNARRSRRADDVTTIKGYSQRTLRHLPPNSFDIIYIDGSHTADDVLADAVQSWVLLKIGGTMIFDDYTWDGSYFAGAGRHLPDELLPRMAVNTFISIHRNEIEVVHSGAQLIVRRIPNPCPNKHLCSPVGPYRYDWRARELHRSSDGGSVALTDNQRRRLERTLWDRRFRDRLLPARPMEDEPAVRRLLDWIEGGQDGT
ncbi:MAG: class I SAM-dependent methyltransferase [Myxococcota bacterium]|nr:class I SAM-dependent methyltransferase [Myxococcota bacterium]